MRLSNELQHLLSFGLILHRDSYILNEGSFSFLTNRGVHGFRNALAKVGFFFF